MVFKIVNMLKAWHLLLQDKRSSLVASYTQTISDVEYSFLALINP